MCCPRYADTCSHVEYPCRFQDASAATQEIIPHRVFAPLCLEDACQEALLWLVPRCLSAAHSVLGTHPFSRLDILIVPANFPSLGMARYASRHGTWNTCFRSLGTAGGMFFLNSVGSFVCSGWKEQVPCSPLDLLLLPSGDGFQVGPSPHPIAMNCRHHG